MVNFIKPLYDKIKPDFIYHILSTSFISTSQIYLIVFSWPLKVDNLNNLIILQAWTTFVADGCGLASFLCILYSLWLILTEDGPAAQEDWLSVWQRPCEERSAMLRRVVGFKWYILP